MHVVDILSRQRAAAGLGLHQQRGDDVLDLGEAAFQQGHHPGLDRIELAMALQVSSAVSSPPSGLLISCAMLASGAQRGEAVGFHICRSRASLSASSCRIWSYTRNSRPNSSEWV